MKLPIGALWFAFSFSFFSSFSQSDSLGMAGDHLDLKAVLTLFKESTSTEEFEKKLNAADTKVNNLDLNGDGQVDYIRVVDTKKDDEHSIILQAPISQSESQDVAVIHVDKKGDENARLQIVGDETLYGKDYIIEPEEEKTTKKGKKKERNEDDVYAGKDEDNVVVNVWTWPSVVYLYSPGYVTWVSPWYWGYYPGWYSPWAPYPWYVYHSHIIGYSYFVPCRYGSYYYNPDLRKKYYGKRTSSGYVEKTAQRYEGRNYSGQRAGRKRNDQPAIKNENKVRVKDQQKKQGSGGRIRQNDKTQPNTIPNQRPNRIEKQPSPQNTPRTNPSGGNKSRPR